MNIKKIALCCYFLSSSVWAADIPASFKIDAAQLKTLAIQMTPLQGGASQVKSNYPAKVVVPMEAEQVVSASVGGLITQVLVQPHQAVRAGTPLLRITSPELGPLQLQLLQANSKLNLAKQTAQREQQLFEEGIIAQRRVNEANATLLEAEATLVQIKTSLRLAGFSAEMIAQVLKTNTPLNELTLSATRGGIVSQIEVKLGQRVEAATSLLHISQTDQPYLEIQLPVAESTAWPMGSKLEVVGRGLTARVVSISPNVDIDSQTMVLRAKVNERNSHLRIGELVSVMMPSAAAGWDVPLTAIAYAGKQAYVFVQTSTGFDAKPVKIVSSAAQRVRVSGDIKQGDVVASSGVVMLKRAWLNSGSAKTKGEE